MHKTIAAVAGTTLLLVSGLSVKAIPVGPMVSSPDHSPIEKIGCSRGSSNDTCPYGYQPRGHGCQPCGWNEKHGSRYRDWNDRYSERRRYRDYDNYEPRRYRDYDEGYAPRRYPREYY